MTFFLISQLRKNRDKERGTEKRETRESGGRVGMRGKQINRSKKKVEKKNDVVRWMERE